MNDRLGDLNLVVMTDGNLYHRKSDRLGDQSLDAMMDASRVNRNCVRHDLKMDATMVVKNLHVK